MIFPFILLVNMPGGEIVCNVLPTQMFWEKGVLINPGVFPPPFSPLPPVKDQRWLWYRLFGRPDVELRQCWLPKKGWTGVPINLQS